MYAGPIAEGEEALRAIREFGPPDADGAMPYTEMQSSIDDPPGMRNYWTAEYVADLPDETLDRIATAARTSRSRSARCSASRGAAPSRGCPRATLRSGRDAKFIIHPLVLWEDPADDEAAIAWGRGFRDDVADVATGHTYTNFDGEVGDARVKAAFGPNRERLARIKAEWDPQNVFRATGYVPPSSPD